MKSISNANRILSIDALRGFDMLMIIFADRFFYTLNKGAENSFTAELAKQFEHPEWFGFHFYDIIMPLFLFLVGLVIPFSLEKRNAQISSKKLLYPHLFKRFVILFILGWIVQGNLLSFDINQFKIFSNTLQAIAVGYLFSCFFYINFSKKVRYFLFLVCLIVYSCLLEFISIPGIGKSELLPDKNIALYIDHLVFGRFDDGYQYTWLLTGLGFIATTLSGLFAGELLRSHWKKEKIVLYLVFIGVTAICLSSILNIWHPIVKKIWTSTFVLFSSGLCYLLLALFYWIIDIKGYVKWSLPLKVIGINAITAYVASHIIDFPSIAKQLLFGFEQFLGKYYDAFTTLGGFAILYLILWYMHKNKTYIKI